MKKKLLAMLLSLCMVISLLPVTAFAANSYTDIDGHWAEEDIERWSDAGIVNGVAPGIFNPEGNMTRAEAAQVFTNLLQLTEKADISGFTDVAADDWFADAIAACVERGILTGVGDNQMNPNGSITREMFFVMFVRALGIPEEDTLEKSFDDSDEISSWAEGAVYALVNHEYVVGRTATDLVPQGEITRASVMALLNQTIVAYVTENGTVEAAGDGVVLVLADDVTVTGNADVTISVVSEDADVSLKGMDGDARVVALADNLTVTNAPVGTVIAAEDGVNGTRANGRSVSEGNEIVITKTSSGGGGGGGTPTPDTNEAEEAMEAAWDELAAALAEIKGHNDQPLVTADQNGAEYTLTLDVDAIQAGAEAFGDDFLTGLATRIGEAMKEHFGGCTLTVNGETVYAEDTFQNTALKNALFDVADGFFYTLANMTADGNGVYTYKTVDGQVVAGDDSYALDLSVKLQGQDMEKVQELAQTLADHLQMETLSTSEISSRYGITVSENEAAVVTMEMPEKLMQAAADLVEQNGQSGDALQDIFDRQTVNTFLTIMQGITLDDVLGSGAAEINSVLTTVNSNANLINKVLDKMTVTVNGKTFFANDFKPEEAQGADAWQQFMGAVIAMTSNDIKNMKPSEFKVNVEGSSYNDVYYAVPVTVAIDLEDSLGFSATETVVVVLHIDFDQEEINSAQEAVQDTWTELNTALAGITGHEGKQLVTATIEGDTAALTLDVDAIMAGNGTFGDSMLDGLATRIKDALDTKFGEYTLTIGGQEVYVEGEFQNTSLKTALFDVADGFFYTLANMEVENGVYTFKTVEATAAGEDSYSFEIAVNLQGEDVAKVQELADTLAEHLQMEMLDADEISSRYGVTVSESEAAVVTMEMPDALMQKAAELVEQTGQSGDALQTIFDRQTVGTFLTLLNNDGISLDAILGSGADEINSVLTTVNSNEALINKVLSKMTVTVNNTEFFTETGFQPGTDGDAYHNFMDGVIGMTTDGIKNMKPSDFKVSAEGEYKDVYYAVPVTVDIDLESSMGFSATETVVVVLHIDFSEFETPVTP